MPPKAKVASVKARGGSTGRAKAKGKPKSRSLSSGRQPAPRAAAGAAAAPEPSAREAAAAAPAEAAAEAPVAADAAATAAAAEPAAAPAVLAAPPPAALAPAVAARPTVAERISQLDSLPDPWADISDPDAYLRVKEEAWADADVDDLDAPAGAVHVIAKNGGHSNGFTVSDALARAAVSLDASENAMERADVLPALWLRSLSLGGNPFQSMDSLADLFPRLLVLDVSYVEFPSVDGIWSALAQCRRLRALVAEGAGISSFEDMEAMPALEVLEMVENDVAELEELETLGERCPALARLDLRENPVATERGYFKAADQCIRCLVWHDNQTQRQTKRVVDIGHLRDMAYDINREINAVDGLWKNEGCSCLEGNPCLDPSTCVDWKNREAVAADARRRKGLRDSTGRQL